MSNFNENTRVQVPAALHLCKLGYEYLDEKDIMAYDHKTNILTDVFLRSIRRINPDATGEEVSMLYSKIINISDNADLGREFYALLSANSGVKLVDFENSSNEIIEGEKRGTLQPSLHVIMMRRMMNFVLILHVL